MPSKEPDRYDYVTAKLPRTGKDGSDITGDRPGKGGRHRADGTYSGPVFDIEIEDGKPVSRHEHDAALRERDELSAENQRLGYANYELRVQRKERERARRQQEFDDTWGPLIRWALDKTVDYAVDRSAYAWTTWGKPFVKRTSKRIADQFTGVAKADKSKSERLIIDESTEVDFVSDRPTMRGDEAGRRMIRVALLVELLSNEMRVLDGVEIEGNILDVGAVSRALTEKATAGEPLTEGEVSKLETALLRLSEPPAPQKHLE